jgi:membrane-associated protease RseP (regulator of RpoE activity)
MNWFYLVFLLGFYLVFRKRLEWVFPMFIVRSTKFTKEIYEFGNKHQWILRGFFTVGVVLGIILMLYAFVYLVGGVVNIKQEEIARLSIVLPDQEVGGVTFPLIHWIIAISITLIVHELGHGIASSAERSRPKNVAFVMFLGLLPGAGVELDEDKLKTLSPLSRLRIMSAGSFMNILVAILILMINIPLVAMSQQYSTFDGILIIGVESGSPADGILEPGSVISGINDVKLTSLDDMQMIKEQIEPNQKIYVQTNKGLQVIQTDSDGKIGFTGIPKMKQKEDMFSQSILWFIDLLGWTFLVCLGIGVANMMPLWPFDGGFVIKEVVEKLKIDKALVPIYAITLILVLINLFSPQIRAFLL